MSDSRLKSYALTAGGAALAAAGMASADIQTSSGSTAIPVSDSSSLTLFTVGGVEVQASNEAAGSWAIGGTASATMNVDFGSLTKVNSGVTIGTGFTGVFTVYNRVTFSAGAVTSSSSKGLPTGSNHLIGLSLGLGGTIHYAWIDYSLSMFEGEYTFTVNRWAYNDVANEGIIAGQNLAAGSTAVPGLGGLAALAIGAAGVRSRRQRTVA